MSFDSSNHEIGMGKTDNAGAKKGSNSAANSRHDQSIGYLNERTLAIMVIFCMVLFTLVWVFPMSNAIRYSVSGLIILIAIANGVLWVKRRVALQKLREEHVSNYKN